MANVINGKTKHNWTTNGTTVETDVNLKTRLFLDDCSHLTPARDEELDNLLKVSQEVRDHNAGIKIIQTGCKPSAEVIEALDTDQGNWMDSEPEPTAADMQAIESGV